MLINKDEIAKKVLAGEINNKESLNAMLRTVIKDVVERALKTEHSGFLGDGKDQSPANDTGNHRNGFTQKEVSSKLGPIELDVPRDRNSEFSPQIKKTSKAPDDFEGLILSMYAKGMSTRDIQDHIKEIYNYVISAESVSRIIEARPGNGNGARWNRSMPLFLWMPCFSSCVLMVA